MTKTTTRGEGMKYRNFEDYLCMKFMKDNPHFLDDDYPDVFDEYISEIDPSELIELADKYVLEITQKKEG